MTRKQSSYRRSLKLLKIRLERFIELIPVTLPVIAVTSTIMVVTIKFIVDKETNLSSWLPPLGEITLKSLAIILEYAETIAIVSAVAQFFIEASARKTQRQYEAWQVIDNAHGIETSYARYKALQDLNSSDITLEGLDAQNADLKGIHLPDARLTEANLEGANLQGAYLGGVNLEEANVKGVNFIDANLEGANLQRVNFKGAILSQANLNGANLDCARLEGICLLSTKFDRANLEHANLNKSKLYGASLQEASLGKADLIEAQLDKANLKGANLYKANLRGASLWGTTLTGTNLTMTNLENIEWSSETIWPNKAEVAKARNIPEKLRQELGIMSSKKIEDADSGNTSGF